MVNAADAQRVCKMSSGVQTCPCWGPFAGLWAPALRALGAPAMPAREASSLSTSQRLVVCLHPLLPAPEHREASPSWRVTAGLAGC